MEAMRHLSKTFRLVNEKLSRDEAVSDTTIAVIVMMSHYERLQNKLAQGLIHLDGLHRMVNLRGGISQLRRGGLALKIFR